MQLAGRTALVTGGGVRIGRALALGLASRGVRVVVHYNSSVAPAQEVVREIRAGGGDAVAVQADLRDTSSPGRLIERGTEAFGQVDILVNSAAIFLRGTLEETTERSWDEHFAINLKAPFFLCQAFARQLGKERQGHIINIADWRATRPGVAYVAYTLTKGALITMTQSLALALAPNVQVNAIAPGAILPPPGDPGGYFARLAKSIPAQRVGAPEDVVRAALYLLDSDFVTGELLFVTGGEHL